MTALFSGPSMWGFEIGGRCRSAILQIYPAPSETPKPLKVFGACLFAVVLFTAGCSKSISKLELRGVTSEIVAAAQKATEYRSEITIRPEAEPAGTGKASAAADDIFVTFGDASQSAALKQAIEKVAHDHSLAAVETDSAGVLRLDLTYKGVRTHTVQIATAELAQASTSEKQGRIHGGPRLAIILDDMGQDQKAADAALKLPFPITISIIPHLPLSTLIAEEAYRRGDQVLLHLPMEAEADGKAEPIELRVGMQADQVERDLDGMLQTVPHAAGVNNHQGSRATADPRLMAELMPALRKHGLFFIDSRTTAATVAHDAAEHAGVRSASRKVFLDDHPNRGAVLAQLELAARDAERDGFAIAIGHPHSATIAALAEGAPRLRDRGMRLVFASDLVQ